MLELGSYLEIRGVNGAGKTTLLNAASGRRDLKSGFFSFNSRPIDRIEGWAGSVCLIKDRASLRPYLTVYDQIRAFFILKTGECQRDYIEVLAESLGLGHKLNHKISTLSLGQQKRVQLSKLSIGMHPIWLLDEPESSLDEQGLSFLKGRCEDYLSRGGIILYTTHHPTSFLKSTSYRGQHLELS